MALKVAIAAANDIDSVWRHIAVESGNLERADRFVNEIGRHLAALRVIRG